MLERNLIHIRAFIGCMPSDISGLLAKIQRFQSSSCNKIGSGLPLKMAMWIDEKIHNSKNDNLRGLIW